MAPQQTKVNVLRDIAEEGSSREEKPERARPSGRKAVVKVPSLLFDIELEDAAVEEHLDEDLQDTVLQVKSLVRPKTAFEHQLWDGVEKAQKEVEAEGSKLDAFLLANKLQVPGHVFKIRAALGSGCSGNCLRQLRHHFLTCSTSGSAGTVNYIIDPSFREQFEIANPSTRYSLLLAELPKEVVSTEDRVATLVNLLSNEIKRSFQATGSTLPPWRHAASMLSKWRPRRSEDTLVHAPTPSTRPPEFKAGRVLVPTLDAFSGQQASSSLSDVAKVMSESTTNNFRSMNSTSGALLLPGTESTSSKRGRDAHVGPSYSSLLATKFRGVTSFEKDRLPATLFSNKGQA